MPTWPAKTNYATGDVLTAAQMQDIGNALNSVESAQYAAGKNKIINGDFRWNQRNFSSTTTSATYGFDRFNYVYSDGTVTYSAQTFTPGTAPVAGYEAINFARLVTSGQTLTTAEARLRYVVEDVRTLAGQTVTFSFWAKAASGTPKVAVTLSQGFGSGGSASVANFFGTFTLSTSWARYSSTITLPSISGKTIGTDSGLFVQTYVSGGSAVTNAQGIGIQSNTFDFWGFQLEAGNTATPFQTATGTLAGERSLCQRYYFRTSDASAYGPHGIAFGQTSTSLIGHIKLPVTMRVRPQTMDYSSLEINDYTSFGAGVTAVAIGDTTADYASFTLTTPSGVTANRMYTLRNNNSTAGYIGFSAEL